LNKDLFLIVTGRFILIGISLLALRLFTSLLNQEDVGTTYLIITVYTFFNIFLINPIEQYLHRNISVWKKCGNIVHVVNMQTIYIGFITVLCTVTIFFISLLYEDYYKFLIILPLFLFSLSVNKLIIPMLNMLGHRGWFILFSVITAVLSLMFSWLMINVFYADVTTWILGIVFGHLFTSFFAYYFLYKKHGKRTSNHLFKPMNLLSSRRISKIFYFSYPLAIATFFMWSQNNGYRIQIEMFFGLEYLGFLGVGLAVANQLFVVIESLISQYYYPLLYQKIGTRDLTLRCKAVNEFITSSVPIYFGLAIFLTFSIEYILPLLVDETYSDKFIFAIYGVWIEFFRVSSNLLGISAHAENKTKILVIPYVFGALFLNVSLFVISLFFENQNFLLPILVLSAVITLLTMYIVIKKVLNISIPFKEMALSFVFVAPSAVYFFMVDFPRKLDLSYFSYLSVGGLMFLFGLLGYFFVVLKK
tara:strand:- start:6667 stop:8091 length:1425 start_codon:yes stop_codon:yes gene_type:complete